jgi:S-adenosylmethionine/arginine decarboxylase-like enzyme
MVVAQAGRIGRQNSKTFQYIDSVILDQALKTESILYTTNVKQLYISYGLKNKTQSYGGSTIIIFALEDKPCMVPVYIQNGTLIAHLYIHNNPNKHTVDLYCYLCNESIIVNLYCLK